MRTLLLAALLLPCFAFPRPAQAQFGLGPATSSGPSNPTTLLTDPTDSPGLQFLYQLERKFAQSTREGGGAAFASWFADDAVSLANGKPPLQGHDAIARQATWKPSDYQLTWTPDGGEMGPEGQMGYTWGHYSGNSHDAEGAPIVTTGRYMTIWKKEPDGSWKVVLDSSNEGPALDCCKLP